VSSVEPVTFSVSVTSGARVPGRARPWWRRAWRRPWRAGRPPDVRRWRSARARHRTLANQSARQSHRSAPDTPVQLRTLATLRSDAEVCRQLRRREPARTPGRAVRRWALRSWILTEHRWTWWTPVGSCRGPPRSTPVAALRRVWWPAADTT